MGTFRRDFQLSTFRNLYRLSRLISRGSFGAFNLFDYIVTIKDFAKDNMATV